MKPSSSMVEVQNFFRKFGHTFSDTQLLEEALTHCSHPGRPTYQRLEFVGDAVLSLTVTNFLHESYPSLGPYGLTILRSANVSTEKLARACVRHDLYSFLRCNHPDLDQQVLEFAKSVPKDEGGDSHGGRSRRAPKVLADIVESTAAAVYIDSNSNLDKVWEVFSGILEPIITNINDIQGHPMTILKEAMDKRHRKIKITYSLENSLHTAQIVVVDEDRVLGNGSAADRKIARLNAARDALQKLFPLETADNDTEAEEGGIGARDAPRQRRNCFSAVKQFAIFLLVYFIYRFIAEAGNAG